MIDVDDACKYFEDLDCFGCEYACSVGASVHMRNTVVDQAQLNRYEAELLKICHNPLCIFVGETGICEGNMRFNQLPVTKMHMRIAMEVKKPLVLQVRDNATSEHLLTIMGLLRECRMPLNHHIQLHYAQSHKPNLVRRFIQDYHNTYFSFSTHWATVAKTTALVREIPRNHLMIKTDAPYCDSQSSRCIVQSCRHLARCCNMSIQDMALLTTQNAIDCFRLDVFNLFKPAKPDQAARPN